MPQFSLESEFPVSAETVWRWLTSGDVAERLGAGAAVERLRAGAAVERLRAGAAVERLRAPWTPLRQGRDVAAPALGRRTVTSIRDVSRSPHNGCRPPKRRRV